MSITTKFIKAFDPSTKEHVLWLGQMFDVAEKMHNVDNPIDYVLMVNTNPMGIKLDNRDALDWPHIHFVLCASYAKAVLRGKAFTPSQTV
jgi:hypothetical protein